jgi:predicted transcriptional regulator of viral defense system
MVSHLAEHHIPRTTLSRLVANGRLVQVSRGLYALPSHSRSEKHQLAEIAARSPKGVFCLLTALRFHELTTQSPHEIWIAFPNKSHQPKSAYPNGFQNAAPYSFDVIGGKGGNRTLDPGIMSALL